VRNIDDHGMYAGLKQLLAGSILSAICLFSADSQAAIVFEQPPANGSDAYPSIPGEQSADDFALPTDMLLNNITWWGGYAEDPAGLPDDQFRVGLFSDNGNEYPEIAPFDTLTNSVSRSLTTLMDANGNSIYQFEMAIANPVHLTAGDSYYLSIVNQFGQDNQNAYWYWLLSNETGNNYYRFSDNSDWGSDPTGNLAFSVSTTAVPLPSAIGFWLIGAVLIRFVAKKSVLSTK